MKYLISIFALSAALFTSQANASTLYRHITPLIPSFQVAISDEDKIVVNYDFTGKKGIQCVSNQGNIKIDFTYKGHARSPYLPVILQSAHVPNKKMEEQADVTGQFTLYAAEKKSDGTTYEVNCNYTEE